eukprot:gene38121-49986_t
MPVTKDAPAPYAPSAVILALVDRYRKKGLPTPISAETLARSGVSDSLIPRSLYALKVLDLIDESGKPTNVFEGLRLAPEAEYKSRLADWLSAAYIDALNFVDPATSDETQIRDAFRGYNPVGQQDRMVSLFIGLFHAAGVIADGKRQRSKPSVKNGDMQRRPKAGLADDVSAVQQNQKVGDQPAPPQGSTAPLNIQHSEMAVRLLEKFPAFDPSWSAEIQAKWFEGYERPALLSRWRKENKHEAPTAPRRYPDRCSRTDFGSEVVKSKLGFRP